ncbi:unnamed protein product [Blepharisma stoltei]|uniref:DNA replication complex GINS protein PSF2 n=1 Tax=Blepharisma stoltei TaxID=1481888 RepID=A0AAU9JCK0_9CILI|nr:unnamed protein product [Blepharisma stoltei]
MEIELSMAETEFFAESQLITIVPNFREDQIILLCGQFGPFRPSIPLDVPLWLAIFLKKQHKCQIVPPSWMDLEVLSNKVEVERKTEGFAEIDFHYLETSSMLLTHAQEDIKHKSVIGRLIQDLYDLRTAKIRDIIKELKPENSKLKLTNIAAIELQTLRRLLVCTFDTISQINRKEEQVEDEKNNENAAPQ